jgi:hypothetical protein
VTLLSIAPGFLTWGARPSPRTRISYIKQLSCLFIPHKRSPRDLILFSSASNCRYLRIVCYQGIFCCQMIASCQTEFYKPLLNMCFLGVFSRKNLSARRRKGRPRRDSYPKETGDWPLWHTSPRMMMRALRLLRFVRRVATCFAGKYHRSGSQITSVWISRTSLHTCSLNSSGLIRTK